MARSIETDLQYELDMVVSQCVANAVDDMQKTLKNYGIGMSEDSWNRLVDELASKVKVRLEV